VPTELPFPDPPLRSDDVLLRPWRRADVPAVVAACQDPAISRWSPTIPRPYTDSDALAWLAGQEPARQGGECLDLAVVHATSGQLLGAIGMGNVQIAGGTASIGYWLAPDARGHGYITSAVRLLARWAFDHLGLARLELTTDPENVASQRVAARCGFRRAGHLRSHLRVRHTGERRDSLLYSLLPGELSRPAEVSEPAREPASARAGTAPEDAVAGCFVCRKHRDRGSLLPGGPVAEDDLVIVSHVVTPDVLGGDGTTAYLGHLFVEPRRHAPGLPDLTEAEARRVGWWCTQASRALRDAAGAEHVYAAVIGDGVPHLHVHLLPRYPGTPREYWWTRVDEWPQARRGNAADIDALVHDLRAYLAA
jgi:RimJ/RimL family protein N-acetyltransferase/diadenosine tetraphosphate (Ap4A) HIT family hydrolase